MSHLHPYDMRLNSELRYMYELIKDNVCTFTVSEHYTSLFFVHEDDPSIEGYEKQIVMPNDGVCVIGYGENEYMGDLDDVSMGIPDAETQEQMKKNIMEFVTSLGAGLKTPVSNLKVQLVFGSRYY